MESSMDIILKQIIETDTFSREKVNEKKQRLLSIDTEIADSKNAIDEELNERFKKNIAKQTETSEIKLKKELARIDSFYADAENKMREAFQNERSELVEKIFKKVTE